MVTSEMLSRQSMAEAEGKPQTNSDGRCVCDWDRGLHIKE